MTSGNFHPISIDQIKVNREGRQRRSIGGIDVLAESIRSLGLIHPIVVTRDLMLVVGERRLLACKSLGWDKIAAQYVDEVSELVLKKIELEENVKRLNLTWQEEAIAVVEYHELCRSEKPDWSQEDTGEALGQSGQSVSDKLAVINESKAKRLNIAEIPRLSTAREMVKRADRRRTDKSLIEIRDAMRTPDASPKKESIINTDFKKWAADYDGPKFNFIHCDFPYGINIQNMQQGDAVLAHGGYDDTEENYWSLLDCLCSNLNRLCSESAHIMFWFSMYSYASTLEYLSTHTNFTIDPFPLVWLKSDNIGILPDPQRGPRRIYETALFGSRGDRRVVGSVSNAYAAPTDRSAHMSTKPEPVLRHFFRMFVDENSVVLDPTCGSGSALRAAESLGAAHILGIEVNEDFFARASLILESHRGFRSAG